MMIDPMKRGCENQTCHFGYEGHTPRCEIRVAKDCQNRPNLKVFFKASKWMDMLCTSMTTIA